MGNIVNVAVLDDWQQLAPEMIDWSALTSRAEVTFFTRAFTDEDDAATQLADFEVVLSMRERTALPGSLIGRLKKLQMLGITGAHNAALDLGACNMRGIIVCNTVMADASMAATSELALGLLLSAARRIPDADRSVRDGRFQQGLPCGMRLEGKTIGILGLGRLGSLMAGYCKALQMRVQAWSPNLTAERAASEGVLLVDRGELFSTSDVISIHMVLSDRSRGLVGSQDISRMRRGAILINTSRGAIVEETALVQAVEEKRIVAALDVFEAEPLPPGHPFAELSNTVLTPHLGYVVCETMTEFYRQSRDNALAFLDGHPMRVIFRFLTILLLNRSKAIGDR